MVLCNRGLEASTVGKYVIDRLTAACILVRGSVMLRIRSPRTAPNRRMSFYTARVGRRHWRKLQELRQGDHAMTRFQTVPSGAAKYSPADIHVKGCAILDRVELVCKRLSFTADVGAIHSRLFAIRAPLSHRSVSEYARPLCIVVGTCVPSDAVPVRQKPLNDKA